MTDFKWRHFQGDVILWAVRWYCRYPISYRDLEEMLAERARSAKAAKRFLGKALRGLKHWEKPATLNTDKAPSYGAAITELKREGKLDRETAHRQVKYLNNVIEADHGKLKILIKPVRGFKSIPTAYATIKGFEVMRALRKGQARPWCLQPGIRGEVRLVERAFGIGPSALTEAMGMLNHHFAAAA
ncbi:IS6 family transposase [Klebsiella pneumoniae]|uniref:IS6 family transposase n=1 Tax=Klebsiella pneumoniae TaxID=573 RepID=UPI003340E7AB